MPNCAVSPSLSLVPEPEVKESAATPATHSKVRKVVDAVSEPAKSIGGVAKSVGSAVGRGANAVGSAVAPAVRGAGAGIENLANRRLHAIDRGAAVKDPVQRRQLAADMKSQNPRSITPHLAGVSRRGAAATGALIGGGLGFLNPGTDEEGNTKSRLMSAASGAATGGTLGLGAGHLIRGQANKKLKQQYDINAASPQISQKSPAPSASAPAAPAAAPTQTRAASSPSLGMSPLPTEYPQPQHARSQF